MVFMRSYRDLKKIHPMWLHSKPFVAAYLRSGPS